MLYSVKLITLLTALYYCTESHAENKILWLTDNVKTSVLLEQADSVPVSRRIDTANLLIKSLPQYRFSNEVAQSPGITRLLHKIPNSCSPNRMKTPERLKDNIYSLPFNIALGLRLYFKGATKNTILPKNAFNNNRQLISLASLFTGKSIYTLGVEKGRSFGIFLDNQILMLEKHNLVIRNGNDASTSLVKMLLKDRIDYIIDYPLIINDVLNNNPTDIPLNSLRIANSPDYIVGYIACHKGSLGQKIIEDINKELQKLYRSYAFYQAHIRYVDKADLTSFNQAYQAIFKVKVPLKDDH